MKAAAAKSNKDSQTRAVANQGTEKTGGNNASFYLVDNRPEATQLRKLQEMADNSPQAKRLLASQAMTDGSLQSRKAAHLQTMFDHSPRMVAQRQHLEHMFGKPAQRREALEEVGLQMKAEAAPVQLATMPEEEELRRGKFEPVQKQENRTGLPDKLKAGIENLSGVAMDGVKVHYNSSKPAQLQALAYTQGVDIHVAPGQEKHLAHEAWHVAQKSQGRVKPTIQAEGVSINDDKGLEREADVLGEKARQTGLTGLVRSIQRTQNSDGEPVAQGAFVSQEKSVPQKEEPLLQGKFALVQRQGIDEKNLLQGKFASDVEPDEIVRGANQQESKTGMQYDLSKTPVGVKEISSPKERSPETGSHEALAISVQHGAGISDASGIPTMQFLQLSSTAMIEMATAAGLGAEAAARMVRYGTTYTWIWLNAKIRFVNLTQSINTLLQVWNNVPDLGIGEILTLGTMHAGINVAGLTTIAKVVAGGRPAAEFVQLANAVHTLTAADIVSDLTTGTALPTTYGELTFVKYNKTDANPPTTPRYYIDIELKFLPKNIVSCGDVAFMQSVRTVDGQGRSQHNTIHAEQDARKTPLAWSIDQIAGIPSPFYPFGSAGSGGGSPSAATLIDLPSWDQDNIFQAESCVICRSGANQGQVFGCATWGYIADSAGKVTLLPRSFQQMPSNQFEEARAAWNTWRATRPAATRPQEAPALTSP